MLFSDLEAAKDGQMLPVMRVLVAILYAFQKANVFAFSKCIHADYAVSTLTSWTAIAFHSNYKDYYS